MDNLKKYKILSFSALIAGFIIIFILFGKIRNLFLNNNITENHSSIYTLIILSILLIVFFFILSILLTNRKESDEKNVYEANIKNDTKKVKDLSNNKEKNEADLNIQNLIEKILPKENTKLDLVKYTEKILSNIARELDIVQGLFFIKDKKTDTFNILSKYAYFGEEEPKSFKNGESLPGQVAKNKEILYLKEVPQNYITILSGLGSSSPDHLLIVPIISENETIGLLEIASFKEFNDNLIDLFKKVSEQIGKVLIKY